MKIITDREAYVQKNDIVQLNTSNLEIPASIYLKIFGSGITIIDDSNRYEFVKFEEAYEIEFLKSINWIINYDDVKGLSDDEIMEMGNKILAERSQIADNFNSLSEEERLYNIEKVEEQCDLLEFKFYSLRDFLWFRQGHLKFDLPEGIESSIKQVKEEKGIKKLVKSIFNKKEPTL